MSSIPGGFTRGPISRVLLRTAIPIVLLTSVNGLLTVVDAALLGLFAGPDALAAVTTMFPATMVLVALGTMVSSGMASILARHLGASDMIGARAVFAGAHGLALAVTIAVMLLFAFGGASLVDGLTGSSDHLAGIAFPFLAITVLTSPLMMLLGVQSDALRVEGHVGFMAVAGLLVSIGNIAFNVLLIAGFGLGVAGSAIGTAAAQALALIFILAYRMRGRAPLDLSGLRTHSWLSSWRPMLALGAPRSVSFIGIALGSVAVIAAVRIYAGTGGDALIAAYGIVMRMLTFAYLPLLGLSLGMQAVAGTNAGAGQWDRATSALRFAALWALIYGAIIETALLLARDNIGALFVSDPEVIAAVGGILPYPMAIYFTLGPMMMIASYFQSIGDAGRAAFLSLARTYLFAVPLTFLLPLAVGDAGIWLAMPVADALLVIATSVVLVHHARGTPRRRAALA